MIIALLPSIRLDLCPKSLTCACAYSRLPMGMGHIKQKFHVRAQPASLQARSEVRLNPNDLSITRATHYLRLGPETESTMNVPLRVYALVADLHMTRDLEVFYPDDLVRFGISTDLHTFSSGF